MNHDRRAVVVKRQKNGLGTRSLVVVGMVAAFPLVVVVVVRETAQFSATSFTMMALHEELAILQAIQDTISPLLQNEEEERRREGEGVQDKLFVWQYNNPFFPQATRDVFCHGCRASFRYRDHPCTNMERVLRNAFHQQNRSATNHRNTTTTTTTNNNNNDMTITIPPDAVPETCRSCVTCPERNRWYGRFDQAMAPVRQPQHGVSHYLRSIPSQHRLPHNLSTWNEYLYDDPAHQYPQRTYFSEYNPSIVRIPVDQIPPAFAQENVTYLASYRVTNRFSCHVDQDMYMAMMGYPYMNGTWPADFVLPPTHDMLGLALLRADLSIVADAVYNLRDVYRGVEDSRLFNLRNQLYYSSGNDLHAIWLVPPSLLSSSSSSSNKAWPNPVPVRPKFSTSAWNDTLYFVKQGSCAAKKRWPGKNVQFFVDPSDGAIVAEHYPLTGRLKEVNVSEPCHEQSGDTIPDRPRNESIPERSFGTVDELHFWNHRVPLYSVLTKERGSACCVPIQYQGRSLLLGISHSKYKFRTAATRDSLPGNVSANHFFSTFYAMTPGPPHTIVAISGKFCLGFPSDEEVAQQNPYGHATLSRKLRMGHEYFECPSIHFVSGMVEAVDGKHLIIAYGVGDCSPRMIKVRTDDVLRMLFPYQEDDDGEEEEEDLE